MDTVLVQLAVVNLLPLLTDTGTTLWTVIERMLEYARVAITTEVCVLLSQYATTLRRKIVPDNNSAINRLARQIYLEHREAIDLIYGNRPDWTGEAKQIFKEAVAQQEGWAIDREDPSYVRFRSVDWDRFQATRTGTGWMPESPALLLFQFRFDGHAGLPYLDLGLSLGTDETAREKLFEAVRQNPALFRPASTVLRPGWVILHQEPDYILDDSDRGIGWDDGSVRAKITAWVADFAANRFPAMNEVIVNCLREHEAEQGGQPEPGQ